MVKKKRMMKYKGSDNMSGTTRMLLNKIENLKRFGVDISNSKFKNNNLEDSRVMTAYLREVIEFFNSFDFKRLEQTLTNAQWQASATSITRLEEKAAELGINSFLKPFEGIRVSIIQKNMRSAKQSLVVANNKKSQIIRYLGQSR